MQRRLFLTLMGTAMTGPTHQWLLAAPVADLTGSTGTRVQFGTVEEIDTMTAGLRRMDDQVGGGTLLKMVRAHLRHVRYLLQHGGYDDTIGRRLYASDDTETRHAVVRPKVAVDWNKVRANHRRPTQLVGGCRARPPARERTRPAATRPRCHASMPGHRTAIVTVPVLRLRATGACARRG
ncbi:hypothetical protein [Nocardia amamiensis]|uniref:hypothetical protein n=1 Tax=Nocardia amamiensis TaxID=404578 RepID=UPI0033FB7BD2